MNGLLAPARSHNRAASLPAFAAQSGNGFLSQLNLGGGDEVRRSGASRHQYQSSYSGMGGGGNGFGGLGLGLEVAGIPLSGWAEEGEVGV